MFAMHLLKLVTFTLFTQYLHGFNIYRKHASKCIKQCDLLRLNVAVTSDFEEQIERKHVSIGNMQSSISGKLIRGVLATESIAPGEIILSVPSALALETTNNKPPTPFPEFVSQEIWEKSLWDQRIAFKLLHESKILGEKSVLSSWVKELPTEYSTPLQWDDDLLNLTQYPSLKDKIKKQRKDWREFYDNWSKDLSDIRRVSYDDFVWAMQTINSRSFSGSFEGSTAKERRSLFLFTGFLTLIWPILNFGTYEQSLGAALSVGVSIILRDLFISKFLGLKRYVFCPYIDMINHDSASQSLVSYNYFQDKFEVKSSAYNKGDQIFISYGKQSNDRLLQYYGFIEVGNPNDYYDFGMSVSNLLVKFGEKLDSEVPFPIDPSPETKLEIILNSLRATSTSSEKSFQRTESKLNGQMVLATESSSGSGVSTADQISTKLYTRSLNSPVVSSSRPLSLFDEITVRSLRALYSSGEEWKAISAYGDQLISRLDDQLSSETEDKVNKCLVKLIQLELQSKSTTIDEDYEIMKSLQGNDLADTLDEGLGFSRQKKSKSVAKSNVVDPSGIFSDAKLSAVLFRIEKKKILTNAIS